MLYNINNNNYISVLDIQLWMMHCLLIYYRDHYACQKLLITKLYVLVLQGGIPFEKSWQPVCLPTI
jgi:hypothetical protein